MKLHGYPLFMCGFRPFFLFCGISACALPLLWLLMLANVWPSLTGWNPPGGIVIWHASEMILGFGMAAVAGFLLTAVPEFTASAPAAPARLVVLAGLWLLARLAWLPAAWLPNWLAVLVLAGFNLGVTAMLMALLLPALWRDPITRRHASFAWALAGMLGVQVGFFVAVWRGGNALAWLHLAIGLMMVLIVLAGSRISMNVVNRLIEAGKPGLAEHPNVGYLARPPRRNLAVFCICLCGAVDFFRGYDPVTGWVALATAAAMLNLLNDWHIGRALLYRWALMLYASYWMMAGGYAAFGLSMLGAPWLPSAGLHLLTMGAMGLSIFAVMNIAGRIHAGLWLDERRWVPIAAGLLLLAALVRALSGWLVLAQWMQWLIQASGALWIAAFVLYLWRNAALLTAQRSDGQGGCAEPLLQKPEEGR